MKRAREIGGIPSESEELSCTAGRSSIYTSSSSPKRFLIVWIRRRRLSRSRWIEREGNLLHFPSAWPTAAIINETAIPYSKDRGICFFPFLFILFLGSGIKKNQYIILKK